jgi:hypothetical protein
MGETYANKGDKAKAIYLKKLGVQHPSTKKVQSRIDDLK